jgi:hypothetical protein
VCSGVHQGCTPPKLSSYFAGAWWLWGGHGVA